MWDHLRLDLLHNHSMNVRFTSYSFVEGFVYWVLHLVSDAIPGDAFVKQLICLHIPPPVTVTRTLTSCSPKASVSAAVY